MHHPTDRITHATAFVAPVVECGKLPREAVGLTCRDRHVTLYDCYRCIFKGRKCLFNDALNTFYLRLYSVRHMVKDHSDSEIGNPLPPHGLLFSINSKGSFICTMHHPTDRIAHTTAFVKSVVEHWLERDIAQWAHSMKDRSDDPSHHERPLLPRSYISLLHIQNL